MDLIQRPDQGILLPGARQEPDVQLTMNHQAVSLIRKIGDRIGATNYNDVLVKAINLLDMVTESIAQGQGVTIMPPGAEPPEDGPRDIEDIPVV